MHQRTAFLLKLGLAFAFIYAGIAGLIAPFNWVGYLPAFVSALAEPQTLLTLWSILEILLGFWILSGWELGLSSAIAAILLVGVVLFNLSQMDILFRDISLALAAAALSYEAHAQSTQLHIRIYRRITEQR